MRVLGIDPGEKRIGVAISDPTGTIANPVTVIQHVSRTTDAEAIVRIAEESMVGKIVVDQSLDEDGNPTPQGRSAARLVETLRTQTSLSIELWDESGSTQAARAARIAMGAPKKRRGGHLDEIAATYILQTFLDRLSRKIDNR